MIDVRIDRLICNQSLGIWIFDRAQKCLAEPARFNFKPYESGYLLPEPTLEIEEHIAQPLFQALVNELTRMNFRADSDFTAGELQASKQNLEDLRKIIFGGYLK